jgi:hypothetical protein
MELIEHLRLNRSKWRAAGLLAICVVTQARSAQHPVVVPQPFVEQVRTSTPSSGEVFRGFFLGRGESHATTSGLTVVLPAGVAIPAISSRIQLTVGTGNWQPLSLLQADALTSDV